MAEFTGLVTADSRVEFAFPATYFDFTFGCWFYPRSMGSSNAGRLFRLAASGGNGLESNLNSGNTNVVNNIGYTTTNATGNTPTSSVVLNTWHFMAVIHDGTAKTARAWLGGPDTPVAQGAAGTTGVGTLRTSWGVGKVGNSSGNDRGFDGFITDFFAVPWIMSERDMNLLRLGNVAVLVPLSGYATAPAYYPLHGNQASQVGLWSAAGTVVNLGTSSPLPPNPAVLGWSPLVPWIKPSVAGGDIVPGYMRGHYIYVGA